MLEERPTDKLCKSMIYLTPSRILQPVREFFDGQIDLDPATQPNNPTDAATFFTGDPADGLKEPWRGKVFVNPPYGRELRAWVQKIHHEAFAPNTCIIALLPGQRFEQRYFQQQVFNPKLRALCFVRRRLVFLRPDGTSQRGNPYGSVLYLYSGNPDRFHAVFASIGMCLTPGWISQCTEK